MPSLREIQQAFATAMFEDRWESLDGQLVENGLTTRERVTVYRDSVLGNLSDALAAIYPVVASLVGEAFFRMAAREHVRRHPSTSGDLHEYGGDFARFLSAFPPAASLPYLADVARLEWAYHRVFHAADHASLDPGQLAEIAPEEYGALGFVLHPAVRLLASEYPIHRIWAVNQTDYQGDQTVDLGVGGVRLLIARRRSVEMEPLSPGEFVLLKALHAGRPLTEATDNALNAQPGFDLAMALQARVTDGTLVALRHHQL